MNRKILTAIVLMLTSCFFLLTAHADEKAAPVADISPFMEDATLTWHNLQQFTPERLAALQATTHDANKTSWIQLALISKRDSTNSVQLSQELLAWRERNPTHPGNQLLPDNDTLTELSSDAAPDNIAVLIPQSGTFQAFGQAVKEGFLNAYYANPGKTEEQIVKFYDTSEAKDLSILYQKAVEDGADFIVGPLLKDNVQQLSRKATFEIPILALNYTESEYGAANNFFEFGLRPEDEAEQLAYRAHDDGLQKAIVIAPQNAWGRRMVAAFASHWQPAGGKIQQTWFYPAKPDYTLEVARLLHVNLSEDSKLTRDKKDKLTLEKQRRQDFDVIFLFTQPEEGHLIVPTLKYYYAGDVPMYATSSIYSGVPNARKDTDINGVIICDIPVTSQKTNTQNNRFYAVGKDAYLLTESLDRLAKLPNFPIYGSTGTLSLTAEQKIHRRLPCSVMKNGLLN